MFLVLYIIKDNIWLNYLMFVKESFLFAHLPDTTHRSVAMFTLKKKEPLPPRPTTSSPKKPQELPAPPPLVPKQDKPRVHGA
jgi:hypothetical protein